MRNTKIPYNPSTYSLFSFMKKHLFLMIAVSILLASCTKQAITTQAEPNTNPSIDQESVKTVIEAPTDASVSADAKTTELAKTTPTTTTTK